MPLQYAFGFGREVACLIVVGPVRLFHLLAQLGQRVGGGLRVAQVMVRHGRDCEHDRMGALKRGPDKLLCSSYDVQRVGVSFSAIKGSDQRDNDGTITAEPIIRVFNLAER